MNLCIDQGNSRTKVALFREDGKIVKHFLYKHFASAEVEQLFQLYPIGLVKLLMKPLLIWQLVLLHQ